MAKPCVPELNFNMETASVCSDLDSGIGSCSPTSTGPACIPEHKSVQTFRSTEDYLYAMKEDLAEWLNCLYDQDIHVENFFDKLENGVLLCDHANHVQMLAEEYRDEGKEKIPDKAPVYRKNVKRQTFQARDNIANFIAWCRKLGVPDVILFETEDLVMRKNEKSVVLALLEVARRGAKFGMLVPCLIQLEQEIDAEIKGSPPPVVKKEQQPLVQKITCDMKSLDEMVRELVSQCTCLPLQFPVTRLAEGKYQVGENKTLIFVRILRNHVMVRVGGGWDTLENYLRKHDPCRCGQKSGSVTRKTSFNKADRRVHKDGEANGQERAKTTQPSCPNTPPQSRRSVTPECNQSTVPARKSSTPERPRPSSTTPSTAAPARRRLSLDQGDGEPRQRQSKITRSPSTEMTNGRSEAKDRFLRSPSKEREAWKKERSPVTPERSLAKTLAGSLSDIRQQSEMLKQQLQEDFSDDSSLSSCDISRISDTTASSTGSRNQQQQMSKSFDFSKLREARRASAPVHERKEPPTTSTPKKTEIVRRAQTPSQQSTQREQIIQRRSMTPQPQTSSSRVRSTPTTPVTRRRELSTRVAQTPERTTGTLPRSKTPSSAALNSTLKERLNKYKQETQQQQQQRLQQQKQQQQQKQKQQQQQTSRTRRESDRSGRRDSAPNIDYRSQPGLAGARYKSPSLSALDNADLNLDAIEDIGGNEELYEEMEKMFQQFKEQERAKAEKEDARAAVEAELDRRLNTAQKPEPRESLRDHFNNKRTAGRTGSKTAPNTPGTQRRAVSATPAGWRENGDQIVRRSTPKRSKTPDPQPAVEDKHHNHQDDVLKMCRCCSKLSELLDATPQVKPRKDSDSNRPKTRIPGPSSRSDFKRTTSLVSLASSTDESECSEISKCSMDSEVKNINKETSPRVRRMSTPGDAGRMMTPLVTNRSTIIKDIPRATSPVKALKDQPRSASPVKAFNFKFQDSNGYNN